MSIPLVDGILLVLIVGLLLAGIEAYRQWLHDHNL